MRHAQIKPNLFCDMDAMKQQIKDNLYKEKYDVCDYYYSEGCAQACAKSWQFEYCGFLIIMLNALWIAIDTDYNRDARVLNEAPVVFQVMEHFFCFYFVLEWSIRFCAFRTTMFAFSDYWFIFDSLLVLLMIAETWVMTFVFYASGNASGLVDGMSNASVLKLVRMLRITRLARVARLLVVVPELMILIKGMAAAFRSVFFTLCLLVGVIYIFGIAFVQLTQDTDFGEKYFGSVASAMLTLLLRGTYLDEITEIMNEMKEESVFLVILFLFFVLLAAQTIMNMLIGILCEVVSVVAAMEKEELSVNFACQRLSGVLSELDIDHSQTISKKEFILMMSSSDAVHALEEVGVDALGLVDFVDIIFADEADIKEDNSLSFTAFMDVVLQFRGSNSATVKDLMEVQKAVRGAIRGLGEYLDMMAQKTIGPGVAHVDISGAHYDKEGNGNYKTAGRVKEVTTKVLNSKSMRVERSSKGSQDWNLALSNASIGLGSDEFDRVMSANTANSWCGDLDIDAKPVPASENLRRNVRFDAALEKKPVTPKSPSSRGARLGDGLHSGTNSLTKTVGEWSHTLEHSKSESVASLQSAFLEQAAQLQKGMLQGHSTLQSILGKLIHQSENERTDADSRLHKINQEMESLRRENQRLQQSLRDSSKGESWARPDDRGLLQVHGANEIDVDIDVVDDVVKPFVSPPDPDDHACSFTAVGSQPSSQSVLVVQTPKSPLRQHSRERSPRSPERTWREKPAAPSLPGTLQESYSWEV